MKIASAPVPVRFGQRAPQPWQESGFPNAKEYSQFQRWIKKNELNPYGDPEGTMYAGGNPLFYQGGQSALYAYVLGNFPDKPWVSA